MRMAIGITELSWSGSLFVLGPIAALLIVSSGVGAIYAIIAVGSALSFILIWKVIQPSRNRDHTPRTGSGVYRQLFTQTRTLGIFATVLLILLVPTVFLLTAIVIKLTDRGPIFFFQERIGYRRRKFRFGP